MADRLTAEKLHCFTFPLRPDLIVRLWLPPSLTKAEAARLSAHIHAIAREDDRG